DVIKLVLIRLRGLDPDTVRTTDIPVNRQAFRNRWDEMTGEAREVAIAEINKKLLDKQRHEGLPQERMVVFDPDSHVNRILDDMAEEGDNDVKRWNRFKRRETRDKMAFIVISLRDVPAGGNLAIPFVSFDNSLRAVEENAAGAAYLVAESKTKFEPLFGVTTI